MASASVFEMPRVTSIRGTGVSVYPAYNPSVGHEHVKILDLVHLLRKIYTIH